MNSVIRLLSMSAFLFATVLAAAPAQADRGNIGVSLYGGGHHSGYAIHYRPDRRDRRHYPRNDYRPSQHSRAPWCPTHDTYHNHAYGYYGFNGGYYGVHDGTSYEEVFSRAYDDGYADGFNQYGRSDGGSRAYRKGYDQGYRDGRRDGRNGGRGYR